MSVNKIVGVPEGWELVRIGAPAEGELYIHPGGGVDVCKPDRFWDRFGKNYAIVRKIEPPKPIEVQE